MSTSTGSEPRLRVSKRSMSDRFLGASERLKRYHGELVLLLGSVSDTIGHRISAPPEDRRFKVFFRFFVFPLWQLLRFGDRLSEGIELRRCCSVVDDVLVVHKKSDAGIPILASILSSEKWKNLKSD